MYRHNRQNSVLKTLKTRPARVGVGLSWLCTTSTHNLMLNSRPARVGICLACPEVCSFALLPTAGNLDQVGQVSQVGQVVQVSQVGQVGQVGQVEQVSHVSRWVR